MTTLVEDFARFASDARQNGANARLRRHATRSLLDMIGNSLAAASECSVQTALAVATERGGGIQARTIGGAFAGPAADVAFVNGSMAHALDFDDTHLLSVLHPSSSVISASLAAAERAGATWNQLLDAIIVGNELCSRLGVAGYDPEARASIFFERGQHATSICGTVASALAAGMLEGLDAEGLAAAMAIAASMGSGILEANRTGGTVKRVHCGWAAHAGVFASDLARHGLTGPPTVFEGRFGFFYAWCGELASPQRLTDGLGDRWEVDELFFKPYPCNHFTHAGVDAALRLKAKGLDPSDISEVELGAPHSVLRTIAEPAAAKAAPPTGYAGAFSGPYTVAAALDGGGGLGVWLDDFTDEAVALPLRRDLAARVRCFADERCTGIFPKRFPAVLRVRTKAGSVLEERVDANRGGGEVPLTDDELRLKFRLGARRSLTPGAASKLEDYILGGPGQSVTELLSLTQIPG